MHEPIQLTQGLAETIHHVVHAALQVTRGVEVAGVQVATAVVGTETRPHQDAEHEARHEPPTVALGLRDDRQEGVEQSTEEGSVRDEVVPHLADRPDEHLQVVSGVVARVPHMERDAGRETEEQADPPGDGRIRHVELLDHGRLGVHEALGRGTLRIHQTLTLLDRPGCDSGRSRKDDGVADDERDGHLVQLEQRRERPVLAEYHENRERNWRRQPNTRSGTERLAIHDGIDEAVE